MQMMIQPFVPGIPVIQVHPPCLPFQFDNHAPTHPCVSCVRAASAAALQISEKQRVRVQRQAMAMSHYCSLMADRAKMMLRFIEDECPSYAGNVLTLFRKKYPQYGLRAISLAVTEKIGNVCHVCVCVRVCNVHMHACMHTCTQV